MRYRVKKMPCKLVLGGLKMWAKKALRVYGYQWYDLDTCSFCGLALSLCDGDTRHERASVAAFQRWALKYNH